MALPSSGQISFSNIAGEFGGSIPHSLSEYYGSTLSIPNSGAISVSQFYGQSAPFTSGLLHTLDNPNAYNTPANDQFGSKVDIDGNYAIVGAVGEDEAGGSSSGIAYIFNVTTGALVHTLTNPNVFGTPATDFFSVSVGISGNYAIVGAHLEDDSGGNSSGAAYIFNVTTGNLVHTLTNPNAFGTTASDFFGFDVDIDGNYAIVGAYQEDYSGGSGSGRAYIYNVTTGALVHTLDDPNAFSTPAGDQFGWSVGISGNNAIIGALNEDDSGGSGSGKAYIFNVTSGALIHTLSNPNAFGTSANDQFGGRVAICANNAIVSAYNEDDASGNTSGVAYIYNVTTGSLVHTLLNANAFGTRAGDSFSWQVDISNKYAIVGAYNEDDAGGTSSGKAYLYDVSTGSLLSTFDNPNAFDISNSDQFAYGVAVSDFNAIIGARFEDETGNSSSGKAYIF